MTKNVKLVEMQFDSLEDLFEFLEKNGKEEIDEELDCEDTDEFEVYDDDYTVEDALELADLRIEELEEENRMLGNTVVMLSKYVKTLQRYIDDMEDTFHQQVEDEFELLRETMNDELDELDDYDTMVEIISKYSDCE